MEVNEICNSPRHNHKREVVLRREQDVESRYDEWKTLRIVEFGAGHESLVYFMLHRARFDEFDNDVPAASVLSKSDLALENIQLRKCIKNR